jgi:hypothetical protein
VGKYLTKNVEQGVAVHEWEVTSTPDLPAQSKYRDAIVKLDAQPELIRYVDAGAKVDLYTGGRCVATEVPVRALLCNQKFMNCSAVLQVTETQSGEIQKISGLQISVTRIR